MPDGQTSVLELKGGTDAAMAPPVAYADQVLLPMLQKLQGVQASIDLQRRGFFPKVSDHKHSCTIPWPAVLLSQTRQFKGFEWLL